MWFWPGSVRYVASGSASASARAALLIQAGLLPPAATSVGTLTPAHSPGANAVPRW